MKKRSQVERIFLYLLRGKHLTPAQALSRFGSMRLGARIYEIKRWIMDGKFDNDMVIRRKLVKARNGKRVASYWLEEVKYA